MTPPTPSAEFDEHPEIGIGGERPEQRNHRHRQELENVRPARDGDTLGEADRLDALEARQDRRDPENGERGERADADEGGAPARDVGEEGSRWHADHGGERHAGVDERDRAAALSGPVHRGGEGGRRRHVSARGEREQDARRGEHEETRREGREDSGGGEGAHGDHKHALALDARRGDGEQGRAEGVGEGEHCHKRAGGRRRDAEVPGDGRQDAEIMKVSLPIAKAPRTSGSSEAT